jgi:chorismate-pyruvate lyase
MLLLCSEFWQRYVLWCEANQPEAAAAVLCASCHIEPLCVVYTPLLLLLLLLRAEFWQRYVLWCEANQPEAAAAVLARAAAVHCKRRPDLAVFAARFHEAHGDADAARAAYKRVLSDLAPGLLEVRS